MSSDVWRRAGRLLATDDPETGWLVRAALTAVVLWSLLTWSPGRAEPWVWVVLAVGLTCWLVFAVSDPRLPRTSLAALALGGLLAAVAAGPAHSAAITLMYVSLGTFALHLRPGMRPIVALLASALAVSLASMWLARASSGAFAWHVGLLLIVMLFALHRRQYRLQARQTAELLEQVRRAQHERARAAALNERARIARELHDVLAHSLGGLSVQLDVAEALLTERPDADTAAAADRVRRSRRLAAEGLEEARAAVAALRDDVPPLGATVAELATTHRADHGVRVDVRTTGTPRPMSPAAEVSLARTAREALTNAARHAPGAALTIELAYLEGRVRLSVRNEAVRAGAAPRHDDPAGGHGLTGMRERLALAGGTLEAGPERDTPAGADGRWRVTAEVPE